MLSYVKFWQATATVQVYMTLFAFQFDHKAGDLQKIVSISMHFTFPCQFKVYL